MQLVPRDRPHAHAAVRDELDEPECREPPQRLGCVTPECHGRVDTFDAGLAGDAAFFEVAQPGGPDRNRAAVGTHQNKGDSGVTDGNVGPPESRTARSSAKRARMARISGSDRVKAAWTRGSKWVPTVAAMIDSASSSGRAGRYGRFDVSASKTSATATIRDSKGMSSPARPRG